MGLGWWLLRGLGVRLAEVFLGRWRDTACRCEIGGWVDLGVSGTGFLGCSGWGVWVVFWLVVVDLWHSWLVGVVLWLTLGVVLGFVIVLL